MIERKNAVRWIQDEPGTEESDRLIPGQDVSYQAIPDDPEQNVRPETPSSPVPGLIRLLCSGTLLVVLLATVVEAMAWASFDSVILLPSPSIHPNDLTGPPAVHPQDIPHDPPLHRPLLHPALPPLLPVPPARHSCRHPRQPQTRNPRFHPRRPRVPAPATRHRKHPQRPNNLVHPVIVRRPRHGLQDRRADGRG